MLVATIASVIIAQPTAAVQQLPDMNHMVRDGLIGPRRSTITVQWHCPTSPKLSQATLTVTDLRKPSWNTTFRMELTSVTVEGKKVSNAVVGRIQAGLSELTNLETFLGQCSGRSPGLFIKGYRYNRTQYEPKVQYYYLR